MRSLPEMNAYDRPVTDKILSLKVDNTLIGKSFTLRVHWWTTVFELKSKIMKETGIPIPAQRLFARNCELENNNTLESYNILRKGKNKVMLIQRRNLDGQK